MKSLKHTLLVALALFAGACSSDPTDRTATIRREALMATQEIGVYCDGEAQVLFDTQSHQLFVDPAKTTFRIQNDRGDKFLEVTLSGMPTDQAAVTGTIRGNLGMQSADLKGLLLLRSADELLWLWSDDGLWGMVLPWPGV